MKLKRNSFKPYEKSCSLITMLEKAKQLIQTVNSKIISLVDFTTKKTQKIDGAILSLHYFTITYLNRTNISLKHKMDKIKDKTHLHEN